MKTLSEKAMLVALNISKFGNRKHDDSVNAQVARDNEMGDATMGNYSKRLINKAALSKITSITSAAREWHYTNTLPWLDNGFRILPAANFMQYTGHMRQLREEFDAAVDEFLADYPGFVEEARARLGKLYSAHDYPTPAKLRGKYSMDFAFAPMPAATDFRVDLPDAEIQLARAQIEERVNEAVKAATRDLWQRVFEAVTSMRDRLAAYYVDEDGKVHHPFRNTAITHLRELAALLPRLNITADPELDAMRVQLEETLCANDPEDLREDPRQRRAAIADANALLAAMAGYVGDDVRLPDAA